MTVAAEIMTTEPVTLEASSQVKDALELLRGMDIRHLPVVDDGRLIGMVSDRDVRGLFDWEPATGSYVLLSERLESAVCGVMSSDVLTVHPQTPTREVVDVFLDHRVGAVPVVEPRSSDLVGIISYVDLLRVLRDA